MNDIIKEGIMDNVRQQILPKEGLIEVINNDIGEIKDEISQPGWSIWAFFGAIATCLWLFLDLCETSKLNIINLAYILFVLMIFGEMLPFLFRLLSYNSSKVFVRKFKSVKTIITNPLVIYFDIIKAIVLLVLTWSFKAEIHPTLTILLYIHFGIDLVTNFYALLSSQYFSDNTWILKPVSYFVLIFVGSILVGTVYSVMCIRSIPFTIVEFKAGLLLWAIYYLSFRVTKYRNESPSLNQLVRLRHDVLIGNIDIDHANSLYRSMTYGVEITEGLKTNINKVLTLFNEANMEINYMTSYQSAHPTITDNDAYVLEHIDKLEELLTRIKKEYSYLYTQFKVYAFLYPDTKNEMDKIQTELLGKQNTLKDNFTKFKKKQ